MYMLLNVIPTVNIVQKTLTLIAHHELGNDSDRLLSLFCIYMMYVKQLLNEVD